MDNTKKAKTQIKGKSLEDLYKSFLERDNHLEKLLEDRAKFWISVAKERKGETAEEKHAREVLAIEKIEKEMNPEIDRLSIEVKDLLEEYNKNK